MMHPMVPAPAFSAPRADCGCEMDTLASVQPHIHAALKIAACVLISLLFVIQVQLLFCGGGGGATSDSSTYLNGHAWLMASTGNAGAACLLNKKSIGSQSRMCGRETSSFQQAQLSRLLLSETAEPRGVLMLDR